MLADRKRCFSQIIQLSLVGEDKIDVMHLELDFSTKTILITSKKFSDHMLDILNRILCNSYS